MKITIDIGDEQIKSLLCCALEGGSNYWCSLTGYEYASGLEYKDFQKGGKFQTEDYWHPLQIIPLVKGCSVILHDKEVGKDLILNLTSIQKGLELMQENHWSYFVDFISGNEDATTGDVFLQCCLFGEVIYG